MSDTPIDTPHASPPPPPVVRPNKRRKQVLLAAAACVAAVVLVAAGAGAMLALSGGGNISKKNENLPPPQTDPLAAVRTEVNELEREVIDLLQSLRELGAEREKARREAESARADLENLLLPSKTSLRAPSAPPWLDATRRVWAALSIPGGFNGAVMGQVIYDGGGQRQGDAGFIPVRTSSTPDSEATRLEARRRELLERRQSLFDKQLEIRNAIESFSDAAAKLRKAVALLRGFSSSDLVFVQPGSLAVGVRAGAVEGFVITAIAEGELAVYANRIAHASNLLRVQDNGRLVRQLASRGTIGQPAPGALARELIEYWKPRVYVPEGVESFVAFHDLDTGEHRVGFYRGHDHDELRVATLKDPNEKISRSRIEPGTALRGVTNRLLVRTPSADFLDFALLEVGKALSSGDEATHHRVAVQTKVDLSAGRLDRLAGYRPTRYVSSCLRFLLESDALRADLASDHFEIDRKLEAMRNELEDRVIEKLNRLGVPVLEREDVGTLMIEQGIAGSVNPAGPERRTAMVDERVTPWGAARSTRVETRRGVSVRDADESLDIARTLNQPIPIKDPGSLSFATHVLLVEIGDAAGDEGSLRYSARLVDSRTGEVVWAGTADRPYYNPAVAADHMLGSGRLIAINRPKSGRRIAGNKLPMPIEARGSAALTSQVAYFEGMNRDRLLLRDLFSYRIFGVSAERMSKGTSGWVRGPDSIPEDNRMRHLMWSVAQAVRPPAGRVTRVGSGPGGEGTVNISLRRADQRLKTAAHLTASRVERDYSDSTAPYLRRMPVDLTIRDLQPDGFVATFDTTGRDAVWSEEVDLQVGDIVCPQGERQPLVAVTPSRLEKPTSTDWDKLGLDAPRRFDDFIGWSSDGAKLLAERFAETLAEMRVPVIEINDPAQASILGATHVVEGRIRPTVGVAFAVELKVFKAGQANPLETIRVKLGREQLKQWRP